MASEAVKRMRIQFTTPGAEAAERSIRGVARAQRDVSGAFRDSGRVMVEYERGLQSYATVAQKQMQSLAALARAQTAAGLGRPALGIAAAYGGYAAGALAIGAMAASAGDAVEAYRKWEDQTVTLNNVIAMTGGAAGKTAADVLRLADSIGNVSEAREAAQALMTFRTVAGDAFDRAMQAANDLSASGFGGVVAAARAMGAALTSPKEGLAALETAGLRFGASQKAAWQDLVETGHRAEYQRQVLDALQAQIGGAGAARDRSLTGAYTALSDAMQRSSETWGQQIAKATGLATAMRLAADAVNAYAKAMSQQDDQEFMLFEGRVPRAFLGGEAASQRLRARLAQQRQMVGTWDADDARLGAAIRANEERAEAIAKVITALDREAESLRKTAVERKIADELAKAGVAASDARAREIEDRVRRNEGIREANDKRAEAERKAAADAERAAQMSSLRGLQSRQSLEAAQAEIAMIGRGIALQTEYMANLQARHQLEQDAARTRTKFDDAEYQRIKAINAELGRLAQLRAEMQLGRDVQFDAATLGMSDMDRNIAGRLRQTYGDSGWQAQMHGAIAAQMRFNEVLKQAGQLGSDFATGFVADLRNGVSAIDALTNAVNRLADRLIQMALDNAVKGLLGNLAAAFGPAAGGASAAWSGYNMTGLPGAATGGYIAGPGTGTSDSIVARISNGEYVVNAAATAQHRPLLDAINFGVPRFAAGGMVGAANGNRGGAPVVNFSVQNNVRDAEPKVAGVRQGSDGSLMVDMIIDQVSARMADQINKGHGPLSKVVQRNTYRRG